MVHASAASSFASPVSSLGSPMSPGSPNSQTLTRTFSPGSTGGGDGLAKHAAHLSASASVVSALFRMGQKSIGLSTKSSQVTICWSSENIDRCVLGSNYSPAQTFPTLLGETSLHQSSGARRISAVPYNVERLLVLSRFRVL